MSELTTRFVDDTYAEYYNTGKHELAQIYLKSEADKVIAEKDAEIAELKEQIEVLKNQTCKMNCMMVKHYNEVCDDNIHQKYKRCLATARWCKRNRLHASVCGPVEKIDFYFRWHERWLELAEKFKEAR